METRGSKYDGVGMTRKLHKENREELLPNDKVLREEMKTSGSPLEFRNLCDVYISLKGFELLFSSSSILLPMGSSPIDFT